MAGNVKMTIRAKSPDGLDFYPTQPWPVRALLERVSVRGVVWEPACGGGHIAEVLREGPEGAARTIISSDVYDYGYPLMNFECDFMTARTGTTVRWIVTNPPFARRMAEKFTLRALERADNVAVLCRLSWMEGVGRYETVFSGSPPTKIIVLSERLGFEPGECPVGRAGMIPYAWYVWEGDSPDGRTSIEWTGSVRERLSRSTDATKYGRRVVA